MKKDVMVDSYQINDSVMIKNMQMGGIFRKNSPPRTTSVSQTRTVNIQIPSYTYGAKDHLEKSQQFYKEFTSELSTESIHELRALFSMVNVTTDSVSKSTFNQTSMRGFRRIFKTELQNHFINLKECKDKEMTVSKHLKNHCDSVLLTHLDIMENINDPTVIENILHHTAISHCFIKDIKSNFQMHDLLLLKFLREEYGKYMHKNTRNSLQKYMTLINKRLQFLIEQSSHSSDSTDVSEAMERQKKFAKMRIEKLGNIKELYYNKYKPPLSEYALISASEDSVYPGTSADGKLDSNDAF